MVEEEVKAEGEAPETVEVEVTSEPETVEEVASGAVAVKSDPAKAAILASTLRKLPDCEEKTRLQEDLAYAQGDSDEAAKLARIATRIMETSFEFVSQAEKKAWLEGKNLD